MVKSCCTVGCTNRYSKGSNLSFYRFPVDPVRRSRWVAAIKRERWEPNEHSFLCSAHFVSGKKSQDPISPDFVPNVFRHMDSFAKRKKMRDLNKYTIRKRFLKKKLLMVKERDDAKKKRETEEKERRACEEEALAKAEARESAATTLLELTQSAGCTESESVDCDLDGPIPTISQVLGSISTEVQTDITVGDLQQLEIKSAVAEKKQLTENGFKCNDDLVKFYTGLPCYSRLKAVFDLVFGSLLAKHGNSSLSLFQEFILTLMKLRLNLRDQDLGFRFNVCQSTVSRLFRKWIDILYIRLQPTIQWPSRKSVAKTMPLEFRKDFSKCICIIDCFEVFCERPSDLMARAQTFSNYKHHKFLIAITPQGAVSYVSKGWGGRVSDKH